MATEYSNKPVNEIKTKEQRLKDLYDEKISHLVEKFVELYDDDSGSIYQKSDAMYIKQFYRNIC